MQAIYQRPQPMRKLLHLPQVAATDVLAAQENIADMSTLSRTTHTDSSIPLRRGRHYHRERKRTPPPPVDACPLSESKRNQVLWRRDEQDHSTLSTIKPSHAPVSPPCRQATETSQQTHATVAVIASRNRIHPPYPREGAREENP